ncbi:hypothetical protein [Sorangium sp. So ce388]|uniref:hypothetical protein n=1 Tax=Sorangium sp. So ce388 TaxID=3133309 RepID=UPI003F5B3146
MSITAAVARFLVLWFTLVCVACQSPEAETSQCDLGEFKRERSGSQVAAAPSTSAGADPEARALAAMTGEKDLPDALQASRDYWDCRVSEAEAQYDIGVLRRRANAFEWHHTASVLIFAVVIGIVCLGFFFAGLQFLEGVQLSPLSLLRAVEKEALPGQQEATKTGLRQDAEAAAAGESRQEISTASSDARQDEERGTANTAPAGKVSLPAKPIHELELSLQAVRLKSSALGLVIWVVSIAFFYLYLAHAYHLHEGLQEKRVEDDGTSETKR